MKVPYFDLKLQTAALREKIDQAISKQLDQCSFALGPQVAEFESDFGAFCGTDHAVAFNSGTSALHVAMRILDVSPGDEVITTPSTFIATSWAIVYCGAKPVFVDSEPASNHIDASAIESAVTKRTKAILPVHLYGMPCDLDALVRISSEANLPLVEDAAQAHGATYDGKCVGSFGQMGGFSFYPGKNLGAAGEGGALITNDENCCRMAKILRDHGSENKYNHDYIGYNYRMDGIQGAVLGVKLKKLQEWTRRRQHIAGRYLDELKDLPLQLPYVRENCSGSWHLFVVLSPQRDDLHAFLKDRGVGSAFHYPVPLHLQKCFADLGHKKGDFPVAEHFAEECLSLPIFPEMTDAQIDCVISEVRSYYKS